VSETELWQGEYFILYQGISMKSLLSDGCLHNLYSSPNIIMVCKSSTCNTHGQINAYKISMGKSEGKRSPGRFFEDNIKIDVKEMGYGDVVWSQLTQDR
jgi:hypothetical protein